MKKFQEHISEKENAAFDLAAKAQQGRKNEKGGAYAGQPGAGSNNFTTNYSSNMPPIQSASMN